MSMTYRSGFEHGRRASTTVAFRYRLTPGAERFVITVMVRQLDAELGRVTLATRESCASNGSARRRPLPG